MSKPDDLINVVRARNINSIAIPPFGCGNGGLSWNEVRPYVEADRVNRKDAKTGGEHAYLFQADISRRNFGANEPLTTRHIWHFIKTRGRLAGIGKLAPHDLRRTAITKAFQQNTPVTAILNMSKHKSVETLMICNKGLDNLDNNAVYSLSYDSE